MNDSEKLLNELKDIREIMDRSSRFLSLSGLSGILVGIFALIGAFLAQRILNVDFPLNNNEQNLNDIKTQLFIIGISVLIVALITIFLLTIKKARKEQKPLWGPGSRLLLLNLIIPLITGAILISLFVFRGYYNLINPAFLIFYGLALVNAAKYTRPEIMGLGIVEIFLGLIAAIFPDYGLYLWAIGFGVIHIIYGIAFLRTEGKQQ